MDIGADQTLLAVRGKSRINYRKPVAMHPVKFALVPNLLHREAVHPKKCLSDNFINCKANPPTPKV